MPKAVHTNEMIEAAKAFFRRHPGDLANFALRDKVSLSVDESGMATMTVTFIVDTKTTAEFLNPATEEKEASNG